jgi:hypothetical protein
VATSGGSVELQDATISIIDTVPWEGEMVGTGPEEEADTTGSSKGGGDAWHGDSIRWQRRLRDGRRKTMTRLRPVLG